MLTDDQLSLVSAAVDRELSPAEAGTFRALLRASREAEKLYGEFADQSARLGRLTRRPAPTDLRAVVLARIEPPVVRRPAGARAARWLPYAVAASALVAVTAWLAARPAPGPDVVEVAPPPAPPPAEPTTPELRPAPPTRPEPPVVAPVPDPTPPVPPKAVASNTPRPVPRGGLGSRPPAPDLRGAPVFTPPPLARVEVRLPFLAPVAELDQPEQQARLAADLDHDGPVRLDLFASDPHRGAEALLAVAKQVGLTVAVDAAARDRMKKRLPTPAYAVYTDSLAANDVAKLVAALAAFDRRPDQGLFGQAHLVQLRDADRRDVRELLGADPDAPRRPRDKAADARVKPGEQTGVLAVYLPPSLRANPVASKEVRDYLARRDDRKPGAVSLLITVRSAGP